MNRDRPFQPRTLSALLALGALLATAAPSALPAVQPEYANLLAMGRAAYDRRDFPLAVRNLRLACFGMLDEPKPLAECLARLALAQDRSNDLEGFQQTFQRLTEIEERFQAYSQGTLAAELRSALEPRIAARIPAATLEANPGFRFLVAKKPVAIAAAKGKPAPKPAPPPEPVRIPPPAPSLPPKTSPPADPAPAAAQNGSAGGKAWSEADRTTIQQFREDLASERTARELRSIFDTAKGIADAHPESREAQHVVGQAAYRLSRWSEAVTYFQRGGDPGDEQAEVLFYIAVSLFESGDVSGAASTLKRSLPNLRRSPYVDKYAKKILGQ